VPTERPELTLRPATAEDAGAMADIHVDARAANLGSMPPMVHSRETTHSWMTDRLAGSTSEGWVAEKDGRIVGYLVLTRDWLDDLFLAPDAYGCGIGSALLEVAKTLRPGGFLLWVFETNAGARRFYQRHGLVELDRTDGSGNEERAPDVRMAWPGSDPVRFFRGLIDDVDAELGDLLARRAALTAAVQPLKDDPERDPARERAIAETMAVRAPALGADRLTRIVHTIITESLDAAR
jgi:chorismate mutase/GNAT superfamily N-acetyltransferase